MHRQLCVVSLLNFGLVVSLAAQQIEPGFVRWEPSAILLATEEWETGPRDTVLSPRRDYRYEGLIFGGIVFGALGAWIGSQVTAACPTVPGARCEPDRLGNGIATGLAGAALGGGLGYLIGRLSPKREAVQSPLAELLSATAVPDSTRRRVGYHHWKGAAIGSSAGAVLGTLLFLGASGSCSDCDVSGDVLGASLVSAGLGGALGFLVGLASPKYE
jgi:hypothetical protein